MTIKTIIFDFDGVITESNGIKTEGFAKLYAFAGEPYAEQGVKYHVEHGGVSRYKKIEHFYAEIIKKPLSKERFEDLCEKYAKLVKELVMQAPFVSGAKEFLDQYSSEINCFVVSGAPQVEVREVVIGRGMEKYFKGVYGSPETKNPLTEKIIKDNGYDPSEVLFVGDALSDYNAAMGNNLHYVLREHDSNKILFQDKDCIKIPDLTTLPNIIESL